MGATIIKPQPGAQEKFHSSPADIAILGGAAFGGKTFSLLFEPIRHIRNPNFGAVIFRRTSPQITNEGGLWDESLKLYPGAAARPFSSQPPYWRFPSGAAISFAHLQHEKTVYDWQGSQVPLIEFDELTHFSESQFFYMLSRNRSTCGVRPYVRAGCNPDADSWVAGLIAWWINQETGYAIPERSGVLRWFYRVDGDIRWYDTAEEAKIAHPDLAKLGEPKSLTFIQSRIYDNPIGMSKDPGYLANLLALPLVERERLLGGNWKIRAVAGTMFRRDWFGEPVNEVPRGMLVIRYWDKAATEGGDGAESAGVLMGIHKGVVYVIDVVHGRWSPAQREEIIRQTAILDAQEWSDYVVMIEREPSGSGKESALLTIQNLGDFNVRADRPTTDKVTRAYHFSAQVEARNVKLKRGLWNKAYIDQHEAFPDGKLKDMVDASSGAFNKLWRSKK